MIFCFLLESQIIFSNLCAKTSKALVSSFVINIFKADDDINPLTNKESSIIQVHETLLYSDADNFTKNKDQLVATILRLYVIIGCFFSEISEYKFVVPVFQLEFCDMHYEQNSRNR
jgi:hypothetical protein